MAKRVLKNLDLTTLLVALDHLEEFGPAAEVPNPRTNPDDCVFLKYIGPAQLDALASRLPHVEVMLYPRTHKIYRKVFSRPAIWHVLRFVFGDEKVFAPSVCSLKEFSQVGEWWRTWKLVH
jgi:hypothetical protein